jgi:hypothetical protein
MRGQLAADPIPMPAWGSNRREPPSSNLRSALVECAEKFDNGKLAAIEGAADVELRDMLAGQETLEFNKCMSAKGWVASPDYLLAP